ncbi:MAG: hypothetical protein QME77_11005 [bacterium]|nr:hypothetical protein [bacterium]
MRVYYTRPLLRIVEGTDDTLFVKGRLGQETTADVETRLKELPKEVVTLFNFSTTEDETIDYASDPIVYMPDEFTFFLDVESLGRLAREVLIQALPMDASIWETKHVPIAELWLGGQDEVLGKDGRALLKQTMREVWALPVRGKVFVLDDASLRSHARRLGAPDAIREAGGVVHKEVSPACDYYATDRQEAAKTALREGAKQVIDTLTLTVMVGSRD